MSASIASQGLGSWWWTVIKSRQVQLAASGWAFFIAENAILSENRTSLVQGLGSEDSYHQLYGVFSTAASVSILYSYYRLSRRIQLQPLDSKNDLPLLWYVNSTTAVPTLNLVVAWSCSTLGWIMASQALPKMQFPISITKTPSSRHNSTLSDDKANNTLEATQQVTNWRIELQCPFDFSDRRTSPTPHVQGLDRITRHPGLWSLALVFAGQAALQNSVPMRVWWTGPTAIAWLGGGHIDSRFRRGIGGSMDPWYESQTSNLPFAAMATGRQGNPGQALNALVMHEIKPLNAFLAASVATLSVIISRGRLIRSIRQS